MIHEPTVLAPQSRRLPPGAQLNDIFEIESLLGVGGMSEVYRARNIRTSEPVAIKVILATDDPDGQMMQLFEREAAILYKINHPAVVRYFLFSKDSKTNLHYLAMEYVPGPSLYERMRSRPLTLMDIGKLVQRVALGMQAAHAESVVHRDISCDNIILAHGDVTQAKIIDFGIAKTETGEKTVIDGAFAGKFSYVSPEQAGLFGGEITPLSDIYSLGLVLAAAFLGKPLEMGGSPAEALRKRQSVPDLSRLNPAIKPIVERMLQPNPIHRPRSMQEVAELVAPFAGTESEPSRSNVKSAARVRPLLTEASPTASWSGWKGVLFALLALGVAAAGGWRFVTQTQQGKALLTSVGGDGRTSAGSSHPPQKSESKLSTEVGSSPAAPPPPPLLPASPAPSQPSAPKPSANVDPAQWIATRELGECAFARVTAIGEGEAEIEGFGFAAQPFARLESDFKTAFGFEPMIGVRPLQRAQCPALAFVVGHKNELLPQSAIALAKDLLGPGEPLLGEIEGVKSPQVTLFVVDGEGRVRDFTNALTRSDDRIVFRIGLDRLNANDARENYLMIALGSTRPIPVARSDNAERLFDSISREISARNLSVEVATRFYRRRK